MNIVSLETYYPVYNELDTEQIKSYKYIKNHLDKNQFINIEGNISYIFLYLYHQLDLIGKNGILKANDIIDKCKILKDFYKTYEILCYHIDMWLADLYCLIGDFVSAVEFFNLDPSTTSTHSANTLMNIKYEIGIDVDSKELLCTNKKVTKFGFEHIDKIEEYINIILKKEKEYRGCDFLQYIGKKYSNERLYGIGLFIGYADNYNLNEVFYQQSYSFKIYCFYTIDEFNDFILNISRKAENMLREETNMPRVGEGWISETTLFYSIKSFLNNTEVLMHYSPEWLGRQHLDIYIPKLKLAFEYQGIQHTEPVEFFGGKKSFIKTKKRDKLKKMKCEKNNIRLYYIFENYDFDEIKK